MRLRTVRNPYFLKVIALPGCASTSGFYLALLSPLHAASLVRSLVPACFWSLLLLWQLADLYGYGGASTEDGPQSNPQISQPVGGGSETDLGGPRDGGSSSLFFPHLSRTSMLAMGQVNRWNSEQAPVPWRPLEKCPLSLSRAHVPTPSMDLAHSFKLSSDYCVHFVLICSF